jgi:replicative DNA helicase
MTYDQLRREREFLASAILHKGQCKEVILSVKHDWHDPRHAAIYETIIRQFLNNGPELDLISLRDSMQMGCILHLAGGLDYLVEVCACVPVAGDINYFAKRLL